MTSSNSQTQAIALHFQNLVRVAGETIVGRVDLNLPQARKDHIEHLRIRVRGVIKTEITSGSNSVVKQTVSLFSSSHALWTLGKTLGPGFPAADSNVLSLPFQFKLPENLPPSFHCRGGAISYRLEVLGDRTGNFRMSRRIRRVFSVVPPASPSQLLAKESLRQGWAGPWKVWTRDAKVRRGIWGDYANVSATLSIPDLSSLPIATPIPYRFHIVTETKILDRTDRPEDKHGKPLFPVPPAESCEMKQVLRRYTDLRADKSVLHEPIHTFNLQRVSSLADNIEAPTIRASTEPAIIASVPAIVDNPKWIPKDEQEPNRGIWRRSVLFNSTLAFPFAPTSRTETIDWAYTMQFVVLFPGLGNNLKFDIPIHLGPGLACPPPRIGTPGTTNVTYA